MHVDHTWDVRYGMYIMHAIMHVMYVMACTSCMMQGGISPGIFHKIP